LNCPHCGQPNPITHLKCVRCGADLFVQDETAQEQTQRFAPVKSAQKQQLQNQQESPVYYVAFDHNDKDTDDTHEMVFEQAGVLREQAAVPIPKEGPNTQDLTELAAQLQDPDTQDLTGQSQDADIQEQTGQDSEVQELPAEPDIAEPFTEQTSETITESAAPKRERRAPGAILQLPVSRRRTRRRKPTRGELSPVMSMPAQTRKRNIFLKLFLNFLIGLCIVIGVIFLLYRFYPAISGHFAQDAQNIEKLSKADVTFQIEQTVQNEQTAHKITFYGTKYESVYIQELQKTYLFTAGQATLYLFDEEIIGATPTQPSVDVTLTPIFYTPAGQRYTFDPVSYTLSVPESAIHLIEPAQDYVTTQSSLITLRFEVEPESIVHVQGENVSDFADKNGEIVHNVALTDFGDHLIEIRVQAPGKLESQFDLTIHRPYMDVPIELNGAFTFSSSKYLTITGTTLPGASIRLDGSQNGDALVNSDGSFEVQAILSKFGENEVTIRASYPGKEDSLYHLTVEYSPKLDEYSKQAWPMNEANLSELYAAPLSKVGKIYVADGTVAAISDDELPIYTIALDNGHFVNIQMVKNKELTLGMHYQIFCDYVGLEGDMSLFIGRYYFEK